MRHDGVYGFYPVVPDLASVRRLLALGVRTIQLRLKGQAEPQVREQIFAAVALGRSSGAQVVINDYWEMAIEGGATHVHLGQGDLDHADRERIRSSGIELGVSTHTDEELSRALEWPVAYVALGPIYETKLKAMPYAPQGLGRISEWRARAHCPLVAIGGITLERAPGVVQAGADLVAVVNDVVNHAHPDERVLAWPRWFESERPGHVRAAAGAGRCT